MPALVESCADGEAADARERRLHNEISPAMPVITTIEQKMIAKIATWIACPTTLALPWKKT